MTTCPFWDATTPKRRRRVPGKHAQPGGAQESEIDRAATLVKAQHLDGRGSMAAHFSALRQVSADAAMDRSFLFWGESNRRGTPPG